MEELSIIVVIVVLFCLGGIVEQNSDTGKLGREARTLLVECEQKLPRDIKCKLEAVSE